LQKPKAISRKDAKTQSKRAKKSFEKRETSWAFAVLARGFGC
jgi:hypothetical protein